MRAREFEPRAKLAALGMKQKLDAIFNSLRLERCKNGKPINPKWEARWKAYIQKQTLSALTSRLPINRAREAK